MIEQLGFPLPIATNISQGGAGKQSGAAGSGQNWLDLLSQPSKEMATQTESANRTDVPPATNQAADELDVARQSGVEQGTRWNKLPVLVKGNDGAQPPSPSLLVARSVEPLKAVDAAYALGPPLTDRLPMHESGAENGTTWNFLRERVERSEGTPPSQDVQRPITRTGPTEIGARMFDTQRLAIDLVVVNEGGTYQSQMPTSPPRQLAGNRSIDVPIGLLDRLISGADVQSSPQSPTPAKQTAPAKISDATLYAQEGAIEVVVVEEGNSQEGRTTISLPWRLAASQRLDQRGWGQGLAGTSNTSLLLSMAQDCVQLVPMLQGEKQQTMHSSSISMPSSADKPFSFPTSERLRVDDLGRRSAEQSRSTSSARENAASETWSERLVRMFGEDRGELAIWVRDYAIRERDERDVVAAIRDHCARNNVHVERIAINGHVLWSARSQVASKEDS